MFTCVPKRCFIYADIKMLETLLRGNDMHTTTYAIHADADAAPMKNAPIPTLILDLRYRLLLALPFSSRQNHSHPPAAGPYTDDSPGLLPSYHPIRGPHNLRSNHISIRHYPSTKEGKWEDDEPSPPTKLSATGKNTNACAAAKTTSANQILK